MNAGINNVKATFIYSLLERYERLGVRYVLARILDIEGLDESDDVDIVVDINQVILNKKIITELARDFNCVIKRYFEFNDNIVYSIYLKTENSIEVLHLHFQMQLRLNQISISKNNNIYLRNEIILQESHVVDRFNVLTPLYYTYVLIVHSIFDKGAFKPAYKDYIIGAVGGSSVDDIQKIFESHFPGGILPRFYDYISDGDFDKIIKEKDSLFKFSPNFSSYPRYVFTSIRRIASVAAKIAKPTGAFVVLLGPDGAGKSSIAEAVHSSICTPRKKVVYLGVRKTPRLLKVFARKSSKASTSESGGERPSTKLTVRGRVFLRTLFYLIWFLYSYYRLIFPLLVSGYVVIGDRYFHDILILKDVQLSDVWVKFFLKVMPSPSATVLLISSPTDIFERKPELEIDEIDRQMSAYKTLGANYSCAKMEFVENTDVSVACEGVMSIIWRELIGRR